MSVDANSPRDCRTIYIMSSNIPNRRKPCPSASARHWWCGIGGRSRRVSPTGTITTRRPDSLA